MQDIENFDVEPDTDKISTFDSCGEKIHYWVPVLLCPNTHFLVLTNV